MRLVIAMLMVLMSFNGFAAVKVGEVTYSRGVLTGQIKGEAVRIIGKGSPVHNNEVLTTGRRGLAVIKLDDGTKMTLRPSTKFNIGGLFTAGGDIAFIPINNSTPLEIVLMVGQSFIPLNVSGFTGTFTFLTIPPGMGVVVDSVGVFTIVATSATLSQLSAELDRLIEEGEFSVEEYFYQIALLRQLIIDRKTEEIRLAQLVCK